MTLDTTVSEAPLDEAILADSHPVYIDHLYVVDGKVVMSDWHGITVGQFKRRLDAKEVRNCDIYGRADSYFGRAA